MFDEYLTEFVQRQTGHSIWSVFREGHVDTRKPGTIEFTPADTVGREPAGTDVINNTSFDQFSDGGSGIVSGSWLGVQCTAHVEQSDIDSLLRKSQTGKKTGRTSADNDNLPSDLRSQ